MVSAMLDDAETVAPAGSPNQGSRMPVVLVGGTFHVPILDEPGGVLGRTVKLQIQLDIAANWPPNQEAGDFVIPMGAGDASEAMMEALKQ